MNKHTAVILSLLISLSFLMNSCSEADSDSRTLSSNDLLDKILARGTLVIATDPGYPPQSQLIEGAVRPANTKCAPTEYTSAELAGFDVETAIEIARRLDIEPCFVTPPWTQITAGNWDSRWDISVGSMAITPERMELLYFTQPYYATPAALFVHKDNTNFTKPEDLSGKRVGGCTNCTYEAYLQRKLIIPGLKIDYLILDADIIGYYVDLPAIQDLALGDGVVLDAVLVAQPTGLQAIKDGTPIKQLGDPVFFEYLAAAIDKKSNPDPIPFLQKLDQIIQEMHQDGTLLRLSQYYYEEDFTTAASQYDISGLYQIP